MQAHSMLHASFCTRKECFDPPFPRLSGGGNWDSLCGLEKKPRVKNGGVEAADGRAAKRARSFLIISVQARTRPVEELNIHSFSEEFDENRATRTSVH